MGSRVFLLQRSSRELDLTSAEKLGQLVPVLSERDSPSIALAPALVKMRSALRDYDPQSDFILAAGGDQLASFLAGAVLTDFGLLNGNGRVNWLRWDRNRDFDGRRDMRHGNYQPVAFNLNGPYKEEWK